MKRLIFVVCVFLVLIGGTANAKYITPIPIVDNKQIPTGGTSVYMIDLSDTEYEDAQLFSVQYTTVTPYGTALAGATVPVISYAVSNYLPPGISNSDVGKLFSGAKIQTGLEFIPIIPKNIAHDGGVSRYPYSFRPEAGRYLFTKVDNTEGLRGFQTTLLLGMHKHGQPPSPIYLDSGSLALNVSSGISAVATPPNGTKYAIFYVEPASGASVYVIPSTVTTRTYTGGKSIASGDTWPVGTNKAILSTFTVYSAAPTTNPAYLVYEYWTGKPY